MRPLRSATLGGMAALAALILLVFGGALRNNFYGDDFVWIYNASRVRGIDDLFTLHDAPFARYDEGFLWPLSNLYFWICHQLFGVAPFGYHLVACVLYLATAALLYGWIRLMLPASPATASSDAPAGEAGNPGPVENPGAARARDAETQCQPGRQGERSREIGAWAAAVFFVLYRDHVQPLTQAATIGEILVGCATMGCLVAFVTHRRTPSPLWWSLSALCMALAILAKESALYVPVLLLFVDSMETARQQRADSLGSRLARHLPLWMICAVVMGWKIVTVLSHRDDLPTHPLGLSPAAVLDNIARYVGAVFTGHAMAPSFLVPFAIAVGWLWKRHRAEAVHAIWIVLATLPYALLVPHAPLYERYTWQPSLGLAGLVGLWVAAMDHFRPPIRALSLGLVLLGLSWMGVQTIARVQARADHGEGLAAQRRDIERALSNLRAGKHVYVYVQPDQENAPARMVAYFGQLDEERVRDWYDLLYSGHLESGDVALFWDETTGTWTDLTSPVRQLMDEARARGDLPALPSGLEARHALRSRPELTWDMHRPEARAQWRASAMDGTDAPVYRTMDASATLSGPSLDASPFTPLMVVVTCRVIAEGAGPPQFLLGWSSAREGGFGARRLIGGMAVGSSSPGGETNIYFYPTARPAWWSEGRIGNLFLIFPVADSKIQIDRIQVLTLK